MKSKLLLFSLLFISTLLFGQENKNIGISGTIQDNQFGILLPIWLGEQFVLAPAFDLKYAEKIGTDVSIGVAPRYYIKKSKVAPYIGAKFGTIVNKPASDNEVDTETKVDLMGGLAFGGEYFLSENFSFGVELQGNFTKSDKNSFRFGNPDGLVFNTATMVSATIYF